ncbi:MAG: hypothetical protein HY342_00410 [Candidatus Lambdaproteobacteria bacterium]|nr:hypothetical protein [Candidatus Lambdaproteobacteria bacterium]
MPSSIARLVAGGCLALGLFVVVAFVIVALAIPRGSLAAGERDMPEFKDQRPAAWLNSPPLTRAALRGNVVLIEIWTTG